MDYFLEKTCKIRRNVGSSAPNPSLASSDWGSAPNSELFFFYIIATSKS